MMLTFGSLFAGIGGIDLGFERAGLKCVWQVEIDDYARRVLAKHWPKTLRHDDVKTFPPEYDAFAPDVRKDVTNREWYADIIAGGFPCQDISDAGKRVGIDGSRSGLWKEFARVIGVLRPLYVVVENVTALLRRGMGRVLGDLAAVGYDAFWDCIPAAALGAHFRGDRVYIVAQNTASSCLRWNGGGPLGVPPKSDKWGQRKFERLVRYESEHGVPAGSLGRVSDGVPHRVHRLRGLGNAVVPQVAEYIGRCILAHHQIKPAPADQERRG